MCGSSLTLIIADIDIPNTAVTNGVMAATIVTDVVLARFRAEMAEIYGSRLDRVVLFGSRARDEARVDSDYDVAVFLKTLPDRWVELDHLADIQVRLLDETGVLFDAKPYPVTAYSEQSPLMREIRREGVEF